MSQQENLEIETQPKEVEKQVLKAEQIKTPEGFREELDTQITDIANKASDLAGIARENLKPIDAKPIVTSLGKELKDVTYSAKHDMEEVIGSVDNENTPMSLAEALEDNVPSNADDVKLSKEEVDTPMSLAEALEEDAFSDLDTESVDTVRFTDRVPLSVLEHQQQSLKNSFPEDWSDVYLAAGLSYELWNGFDSKQKSEFKELTTQSLDLQKKIIDLSSRLDRADIDSESIDSLLLEKGKLEDMLSVVKREQKQMMNVNISNKNEFVDGGNTRFKKIKTVSGKMGQVAKMGGILGGFGLFVAMKGMTKSIKNIFSNISKNGIYNGLKKSVSDFANWWDQKFDKKKK